MNGYFIESSYLNVTGFVLLVKYGSCQTAYLTPDRTTATLLSFIITKI